MDRVGDHPIAYLFYNIISMFILNGMKEGKKLMFFEKIVHLDLRKTTDAGREREPYLLNINMLQQFVFQFNPETGKFYLDEDDSQANWEDMEKSLEECKDMEEDEKEEYLKWRGKRFIKRQEYVLMVWDENLSDRIIKLVKLID